MAAHPGSHFFFIRLQLDNEGIWLVGKIFFKKSLGRNKNTTTFALPFWEEVRKEGIEKGEKEVWRALPDE